MKHDVWDVLFLGFITYVFIRGEFKQRTKENEIVISRMDALEKALLAIVIPGGLLLPLIYLFTDWLAFADYRISPAIRAGGAVLMIAALWLFYRSHADLGRNWSVSLEMRKDHELVTRGVYDTIRHPMYASIWLWSLAQGLLLENWLAGWYAFLAFAVMYFIRVPREERMMNNYFGQEYREYAARTGRIFPRL